MSTLPGGQQCAVLGSPIAHSLSPAIHRAAYDHLGLDWSYTAHELGETDLADFVAGLDGTWRGLSLTMPLKRVALEVADEVRGIAGVVGAANTLVRSDDDETRWIATNTDVPGAVAALRERGLTTPPDNVCLWGAGATTASLVAAVGELGAEHVHVHARSAERARASLDQVFDWRVPVELAPWAIGSSCAAAALTVATTPSGVMDDLAAGLTAAPTTGRMLFDVVYNPWPTALAARWAAGGGAVTSGLDLLIHQAVGQLRLMTRHDVPVDVLRAAAENALAARTAS